jgi:hypothetical protein
MTGIDDEVFNRFMDLCDAHGVSRMAQHDLVEFLYETYYLGYDKGYSRRVQQDDLKVGIANWKKELLQREGK